MTTAIFAAPHASKPWNITLWLVQGLLAFGFGLIGVMKVSQPIPQLAEMMVWPGVVPEGLVRFIGVAELTGALGLILPAATRIKPFLTALAGAGLALVMLFAMGFHFTRGEVQMLPVNLMLGGLAAFVAWGRTKKAPIPERRSVA